MVYLEFFSDYSHTPLWLRGPAWDDIGHIDPTHLGVSEPLRADLAAWSHAEDDGPMPGGLLAHLQHAFDLAARVQLELGHPHEVWRTDGPEEDAILLVLEGEETDLVRGVGHRPSPVRLKALGVSASTHARIRHWRTAGSRAKPSDDAAAWRAEGLSIAGQLQEDVGLAHRIGFLGGRSHRPQRPPVPEEWRGGHWFAHPPD